MIYAFRVDRYGFELRATIVSTVNYGTNMAGRAFQIKELPDGSSSEANKFRSAADTNGPFNIA